MSANAAKNAHEVVLRELLARVSAGKVLDAPCGSGSLASRMSNAGLDVIGLDIEPPDTTDNFEIRRADLGAALPIPDAAIENAVSVEGIEHLERPFEFVSTSNEAVHVYQRTYRPTWTSRRRAFLMQSMNIQ